MATNYKNTDCYQVTSKVTVPAAATKTGTVTTKNTNVVGVGTLFTTEMSVGDWIYVAAQNELRRIVSIESNTNLEIDKAFTSELAAGAIVITPRTKFVYVSLQIPLGLADGVFDGVALQDGSMVVFDKGSRNIHGQVDFIDPFIIDGTGTFITVTTLK